MARPPAPREGEVLKIGERHIPFMLWPGRYSEWSQTLVSNIYLYLLSFVQTDPTLPQKRKAEITAFITQAQEFHEAASNPLALSRPLLHYYSFLNLTKAFLAYRNPNLDLSRAAHGLCESWTNAKAKLFLTQQKVELRRTQKLVSVFVELTKALGTQLSSSTKHWTVMELLGQIVGVHRAYALTTRKRERFFHVPTMEFYQDRAARTVWVRLSVAKQQVRRSTTLRNFHAFLEKEGGLRWVGNDKRGNCLFESKTPHKYGRSPLKVLSHVIEEIRPKQRTILTQEGQRYYITDLAASELLPQSAACFATMFYLGSISRYRPHHFQRLSSGRHGWLIHEFINTQPRQFSYDIASHITHTQIVIPWT